MKILAVLSLVVLSVSVVEVHAKIPPQAVKVSIEGKYRRDTHEVVSIQGIQCQDLDYMIQEISQDQEEDQANRLSEILKQKLMETSEAECGGFSHVYRFHIN